MAIWAIAAGWAGCPGGCSNSPAKPTTDPIRTAFDREASMGDRTRAIASIWDDVEAGELPRDIARERLKDVFWDYGEREAVRMAAMDALLGDSTDGGLEDTRRMLLLALPTEPSEAIRERVIGLIVDGGWVEAKGALVRALGVGRRGETFEDRAEVAALRSLFPGRSIAEIAFEVFRESPVSGQDREVDLIARRTREDAWTVVNLAETDPSRVAAIVRTGAGSEDPWLRVLARGERELGVVPMTGAELDWLFAIGDARHAGWWDAARGAVARLGAEDRRDLALRHLEPLRWASEHRPDWAHGARDRLASIAGERLRGRRVVERSADRIHRDRGNDERLEDWLAVLSRLDLLTLLVIDESISSEDVRRVVFEEAWADNLERMSEFGGLLEAGEGGAFRAVAHRPRSSERAGDTSYVPPPDMVVASATALAPWHLHARELTGGSYAGPSRADLLQAARSGRASVVFTTIARERINADVYFPSGAVVDLGVVEFGSAGGSR